jgi:VWFA-related protein
MIFPGRTIALCIASTLCVSLAGFSQDKASTTPQLDVLQSDKVLRANTRLVVVDVVATDSNNQTLTGLKPEDFNLLENGRPQKISNFSFRAPNAKQLPPPQLPANVITNAPTFQASTLNVMLLDTLNGDFTEMAYLKDQVVKYFSSAQLDRPVALFAMEERLVLLHDFTTDSAQLKSVAERFKPPARTNNAETVASRASAFTTHGDFHTSERNIENTLNQLNALSKSLAGYPGRKNLIWLSESFPVNLFPDSMANGVAGNCNGDSCGGLAGGTAVIRGAGSSPSGALGRPALEGSGEGDFKDYAQLIKKVSEALMKAQVAVYAVDAGALGKDSRLESAHTANEIAQATGGKVFRGTNDLAGSMRASIEDGSSYYTLEYYPDNKKWDGQFRQIQIKSNRPGVNLRYRLGYYALDPEKISKDESSEVAENFSRALQLDAPAATGVQFQAQVVNSGKKVVVNFHIDPTTLSFQHQDDGQERGKFTCTVWAYGKDKDKPAGMTNDTLNANLTKGDYQQMMKQHFLPCSRELDLKPGSYTLRVGVLDRTTNKMGTSSFPVTVQ